MTTPPWKYWPDLKNAWRLRQEHFRKTISQMNEQILMDAAHGIAPVVENRRAWRGLIVTIHGLSECISGAILYDETIRQHTPSGIPFLNVLTEAGILAGIKVDLDEEDLAGHPSEKVTSGLDELLEPLAEYARMGARFAKWRMVIVIGEDFPSRAGMASNAQVLARYAALCQEVDLVPVVEPEVLMDGSHSLSRSQNRTTRGGHMNVLQLQQPGQIMEPEPGYPPTEVGV